MGALTPGEAPDRLWACETAGTFLSPVPSWLDTAWEHAVGPQIIVCTCVGRRPGLSSLRLFSLILRSFFSLRLVERVSLLGVGVLSTGFWVFCLGTRLL